MNRHVFLPFAASALLLAGCMAEPNAPEPATPEVAPPQAGAASEPAPAPVAAAPGTVALTPAPNTPETSSPKVSQACNLETTRVATDAAAAAFNAKPGDVVTFDGWILAGDGLGAPGSAQLRMVNESGDMAWTAPLALTLTREDVQRVGEGAAGNVGFSQAISLSALGPGKYRAVLVAETRGQRVVCDNGRTLAVSNG